MFELPPHIYAVADDAYTSLRDRNQDQCVIITGESGAGKTGKPASKLVMQYITAVSGREAEVDTIKEHLLQSAPVLEAFGNAKTHRNDNSSRFVSINQPSCSVKRKQLAIILEYCRYFVSTHRDGDRRAVVVGLLARAVYTIYLKAACFKVYPLSFNQLIRARCSDVITTPAKEADDLALPISTLERVKLLATLELCCNGVGGAYATSKKIFDSKGPSVDSDALHSDQGVARAHSIIKVNILMLGFCVFHQHFCGIQALNSTSEVIFNDISKQVVVCVYIYSRELVCLSWRLSTINRTINYSEVSGRFHCNLFSSVLNETISQDTFSASSFLYFCLELERRALAFGVQARSSSEWRRRQLNFVSTPYSFNESLALFRFFSLSPPPIPQFLCVYCSSFVLWGNVQSAIFRFRWSPQVTYSVVGFIDKNNDHLYRDLSQAMYSCDHPLMKILFPEGNPKRTTLKRPTTTATQFKISIGALVKNLQAKTPNYVRCIKPNELKQPMIFEMALVQHQVRYLGLVENLKVRRAGFAFRQEYEAFLERYKLLSPHTWPHWSGLPVEGVTLLLRDLPVHPSEYAFGRTKIFVKNPRTVYELEEFRHERLHELATLIQKTWRGFVMRNKFLRMREGQVTISSNFKCWKARREFLHKRQAASTIAAFFRGWKARGEFEKRKRFLTREQFHDVGQSRRREWAARVLARCYRFSKRRRYLLWLAHNLPSESPLDRSWPPAPRFLHTTSHILKKMYHKWRCSKYRMRFDQTARNRMREKVTASIIFRDRKASYAKSVSHPFRGDYVRLRQNVKWKRLASETGDQYVVFADIISKITRSSGKCVQALFVVSTNAMLIMDQRTLQIKYRIPVGDIFRISLSPFLDDIAVFHVRTTEATRKKGDFLFETGHVIEIVTKLFLVIQNATGKPPEVNIATEFEVNFGKENVILGFRSSVMTDVQSGQIKISRKGNRMEVVL
ncbi:unnamed protein product [Ixodes persulcatus]